MIPNNIPFKSTSYVVVVYEVWQEYGGAEEGGWWYYCGALADFFTVDTPDEAEALKDELYKEQYPSKPAGSVEVGPHYAIWVVNPHEPIEASWPSERPRYE